MNHKPEQIFTKQVRPTMTQIALENIRSAIERGLLKPGTRIIESQLSKELGMSRFPIREALCYLEKEGLVETIPFKGVSVSQITPKDIEDLMSVRCALEELAIQLTINRLNSNKINILRSTMDRMEKALGTNNKEEILNADLKFHQSICEFAENGRLLKAWLPLASQIRVCLKMEYPLFQTAREFVDTHTPILEAIVKKDKGRAVLLVREHIESSVDKIQPVYGKD
jgi:DNA-binding GntR family transcriptional regulator